jgi:hypothetical protein
MERFIFPNAQTKETIKIPYLAVIAGLKKKTNTQDDECIMN